MARDARAKPAHRPAPADLPGPERAQRRSDRGTLIDQSDRWIWFDGELVPRTRGVLRADDSAFSTGLGCYSTARYRGAGDLWHGVRCAARLAKDARTLELGEVDPDVVLAGMRALGEACFGDGEGIVRFQASRDGAGAVHLTGVARPVGEEPTRWAATLSALRHPGPGPAPGAKVSNHLLFAWARAQAAGAGADEALFVDGAGRVVEGARTNLVAEGRDGHWVTPPAAIGPVDGVARQVLLEEMAALREAPFHLEPDAIRALVAVSSVRGAVAIVSIDGASRGGPRTDALRSALDEVLRANG